MLSEIYGATREQVFNILRAERFWLILGVLFVVDGIFIALHLTHLHILFPGYQGVIVDSNLFSIEIDGGYGERFEYVKSAAVTLAFIVAYVRRRSPVCAAFAVIFFYTVLDDSLRLHERLGALAVAGFGLQPMAGLRAQDFGELAAWAGLGAATAAVLAVGFRRADAAQRGAGVIFLALLGVLAMFGIGVDMLHSEFAASSTRLRLGLGLLEDGGEMLTTSVICAAAWALALPELDRTQSDRTQSGARRRAGGGLGLGIGADGRGRSGAD